MVTTSNHVLVNMADFGDDLDFERDVLGAKRSCEDDDTSGGESDGTSGTSASSESDAHVMARRADAEELTATNHKERIVDLRSFS